MKALLPISIAYCKYYKYNSKSPVRYSYIASSLGLQLSVDTSNYYTLQMQTLTTHTHTLHQAHHTPVRPNSRSLSDSGLSKKLTLFPHYYNQPKNCNKYNTSYISKYLLNYNYTRIEIQTLGDVQQCAI